MSFPVAERVINAGFDVVLVLQEYSKDFFRAEESVTVALEDLRTLLDHNRDRGRRPVCQRSEIIRLLVVLTWCEGTEEDSRRAADMVCVFLDAVVSIFELKRPTISI